MNHRNYQGPCARTIPAFCAKCDQQYTLELNQGSHPLNTCPCGADQWSMRCRSEVNALVEFNIKLAYHAAARTGIYDDTIAILGGREDWNAQAMLYLIKAAQRWDESYRTKLGKPVQFSTYATVTIKQNMRRWCTLQLNQGQIGVPVKNEKRWVMSYHRHDSLDYDKTSELIPDKEPPPDIKEEWESAKLAMRQLNERSRRIVTMYHLQSMTLDVIGTKVGISKERVRQVLLVALADLRTYITGVKYRRIPKTVKRKSLDKLKGKP